MRVLERIETQITVATHTAIAAQIGATPAVVARINAGTLQVAAVKAPPPPKAAPAKKAQ